MSSAFIDRDDKTHCKSCGAPVQVNEHSCPWCTTAYPADARPAPDISATWDDGEDPSYGGYWVGAGMARPRDLFLISGARSTGAQWDDYRRRSVVERPAVLVTSGVISANEARDLAAAWERAYTPVRDITKPVPPQGQIVLEGAGVFRAYEWLKGLFK